MNNWQKYCSGKWIIPLETNRFIQKSGVKKIPGKTVFFWESKKKILFLFFIFFLAVGGIGKAFTIIKLVGKGAGIKTEPSAGFYEINESKIFFIPVV